MLLLRSTKTDDDLPTIGDCKSNSKCWILYAEANASSAATMSNEYHSRVFDSYNTILKSLVKEVEEDVSSNSAASPTQDKNKVIESQSHSKKKVEKNDKPKKST